MQYLYIADEYNNQIDVFPMEGQNQPQVGTITSGIAGPYAIWFDKRSQLLYVANQSTNSVTVYPYGASQPTATYTQDLSRPLFPITDSHGDLFVSNANNGTVVEYQAGNTNAYQVLQTPGVEADGLALDSGGNLYVAYRNCPSGLGSIEKFAPGSSQGSIIGMALYDPQGLYVDSKGNVIVDETGTASDRLDRIDVFPPNSTTPSLQIAMPQGQLPIELLIDCDQEHLYVSGLFNFVYGAMYPLHGSKLFLKDQVNAVVQGITTTSNLQF